MDTVDERPPPLDPTRVFSTLERHGVDYLVIGGFAGPAAAPYTQLRERSIRRRVREVEIRIVGRDDLIRMKRAAGRDRDLADIAALTAGPDDRDG